MPLRPLRGGCANVKLCVGRRLRWWFIFRRGPRVKSPNAEVAQEKHGQENPGDTREAQKKAAGKPAAVNLFQGGDGEAADEERQCQ